MGPSLKGRLADSAIVLLVVLLPFAGAVISGVDLRTLTQFPPRMAIPNDYPHFSWLAAIAVMVLLTSLAASWIVAKRRVAPSVPMQRDQHGNARSYSWWGWLAIVWTISWWVLAWTRWSWFESFQCYTFFPLWLGFIVVVNAATDARSKSCLMRRSPLKWLQLFGVSALFWWLFEWLNRFVRNWLYLGVEDFGAVSYAINASVCFSTVLPAVAAVAEWLTSHGRWNSAIAFGPEWPLLRRRGTAIVLLVAGAVALVMTGAFPRLFYPALWLAPLVLGLGASVLLRRDDLAGEISRGIWTRATTWMIAAVVCGFFWEMWNWQSAAKWIYTVPGVERWHVFEMPLLGYTGYLPFGLECLLVVERVVGERWSGCIGRGIDSSSDVPAQ